MARVFIDCHMFSEEWFKSVLGELLNKDSVTFVYSESTKMMKELSKVRAALQFYKIVGEKKRRNDADTEEVEKHTKVVENDENYDSCSDCDDSHVFAMIYVKPTPYVFSMDARMARCRDRINKSMNKRYCDFIVISDKNIYGDHKSKIIN
jgi:predicted nucleic acid-binding protein